jgi:diacylglycerol kinase family enzyme
MVLDRDRRQHMHSLRKWSAMTLAFLRVLRSFPRRRIRLRAEGVSSGHVTPCLFVGNNQYGMDGFRLGKRERLDGGDLWIYVAKPTTPVGFLRMVARMAIGSDKLAGDVAVVRAAEVLVEAKVSRLPVALDGEVAILETPLRYRVRPRALTVFVPKARET